MRSRILPLFALLCFPLLLSCLTAGRADAAQTTVTLRATRTALLADGKHTTDLIADIRDSSGRPVGNNVFVQFQTTSGQLSESRAQTLGGVARVRLTSAAIAGVAHVTAVAPGSISAVLDIVFTDDPDATFEGNSYILATGTSYLAYSATDRIIEALGKNGGAKLAFRNLEVSADRLQLRCDDNIVRAHNNITLKRAGHVIHATRLYYSLQSGQGYAIAELDGRLQTVLINGENLILQPSPTPIPTSYLTFPDLQVKLVIVARSITFFPGDKLQFRRPKFYQDQAQILSLPYYELGLSSSELFSDHFISLGTSGLGLEIPFYLGLSPRKTSIVYLRHQQQLGRGYYATEPGWSVDLLQGYSTPGEKRYEGAFGFTGLTRSDWSFRWTHNQEFNASTQGNFYLDFPHHDSVFSSASLNQQSRRFRWGGNFAAEQTFQGLHDSTLQSDVFAETQPRRLSLFKGALYTIGTTFGSGRTSSGTTDNPTSFTETTEGVNMRAFSRPLSLDARTTLTNSVSVGQLWSSTGASGLSTLLSLALDHTIPGGGTLNATYDFVERPATRFASDGKHRVGLNYNFATRKRFEASIFTSAYLDSPDATFLGDLSYRLDNRWRLLSSLTFQTFAGDSYRDLQLTIGRRIGTRELQFTYSTLYHRISLDFTATRF